MAQQDHLSAIRTAARSASAWKGWTWTHDPGGVALEGPGAVKDWDVWEKGRRASITVDDLRKIDGYDKEHVDEMDSEQIASELDALARAEREYGERCQQDARAAQEHGKAAVAAAKRRDWAEAVSQAEQAASIESDYGDCPSYRGLVLACRMALGSRKHE